MKLMIVESPNKVKKIASILGDGWTVAASVGHIRDLPPNKLGVDADTFALDYEFIAPQTANGRTFPGGEERVKRIRKDAAKAEMVYLATDPDREGEAISWHLKETLGLNEGSYRRVTFDAITAPAVKAALGAARGLDDDLVAAQEARRALDRLAGYLVSPVVSKSLGMKLSAGRVQSPALRMVVERERQIKAHNKVKHFGAKVSFDGWSAQWDTAGFVSKDAPYVLDRALAEKAASCWRFKVAAAKSAPEQEAPPSPFSTALLLRAASASLKFDPKKTSALAQKLFEGGHVTYIRTDGVNIAPEAVEEIRTLATANGWPLPASPRRFKSRADAQEAHEAIRPTHMEVETAGETEDEQALYALIRRRTIASQLADAVYQVNRVTLEALDNAGLLFKASGRTVLQQGWRTLTATDAAEEKDDDKKAELDGTVPKLDVGSTLEARDGEVVEKETRPPTRYTQAGLIEKLEKEGVGRPSTYAAIMSTLFARGYVSEQKRMLVPTELGVALTDALVKGGLCFADPGFTRQIEADLDRVAEGKADYRSVVAPFYDKLNKEIAALSSSGAVAPLYPCPKCGSALRRFEKKDRKTGERSGAFAWACSDRNCETFLDDANGKPIEPKSAPCPKCQKPMFRRKGQYGFFWSCSDRACGATMDDKNGKPVPKKASRARKKA